MTITSGIRKGLKKILEHGGGGEEGKPHSTSAGRMAAGARKFRRGAKKVVPGVIEGAKKVAKPFVKEAVGLEKLRKKKAKGGRAGYQSGGRTRLLEELGRVEAEPSNRNRRAEISRVHGELNRGYKGGKRVGLKGGNRPRPQGPHMWVRGQMAQASDKAIKGNKLTKKA